jgi:hypothetical protein
MGNVDLANCEAMTSPVSQSGPGQLQQMMEKNHRKWWKSHRWSQGRLSYLPTPLGSV